MSEKVCLIDKTCKTNEDSIANNNKKCEDIYIKGDKINKYPDFKNYIVERWVSKPSRDNAFASQGLCHIDNNVLITSYDTQGKKNSILDIVDEQGRTKQLKFDNDSHVGGIAYHEASGKVYVSDKNGFVNIYDVDYISSLKSGDVLKEYDKIEIGNKAKKNGERINASYLTVHNDQLLVGNFIRKDYSDKENLKDYKATIPMLSFYNLNDNGEPVHSKTIEIPYKQVQGMSVYNHNGKDYYLFSTSFGRRNDSKIIISTLEDGKFNEIDTITLPCMSEQISMSEDGKLGIVFESDCTKYTGATKEIGNVCYIDIEQKINEYETCKVFASTVIECGVSIVTNVCPGMPNIMNNVQEEFALNTEKNNDEIEL